MLKDLNLRNDHEYIKNQKINKKKDRIKNIIDRGDKNVQRTRYNTEAR